MIRVAQGSAANSLRSAIYLLPLVGAIGGCSPDHEIGVNNHGGGGTTDGGTTNDPTPGTGTCDGLRITAPEATARYTTYAFQIQPTLNPETTFAAEELTVDGLWNSLGAQLFNAKAFAADGILWRECHVVFHACQFTLPTGDCGAPGGILSSGLVDHGAFYFSWGSGSGIYRSRLGKFSANGAVLSRIVSAEYFNANSAPPTLVLQASGSTIAVKRADVTAFNVWATAEAIGTLKDHGDRLAIVDDAGQELPTTLP